MKLKSDEAEENPMDLIKSKKTKPSKQMIEKKVGKRKRNFSWQPPYRDE